jgi:predicted nuclease of predicted toxin-antitoxin system
MRILVDHNLEGNARLLFVEMHNGGWAELLDLKFVYYSDVSLDIESDDVTVWRYAQSEDMCILTDNRNEADDTALNAVIRRENTLSSLPVITVGNSRRLTESAYRQDAATRLAEILFYLEDNLGTGRLFIP